MKKLYLVLVVMAIFVGVIFYMEDKREQVKAEQQMQSQQSNKDRSELKELQEVIKSEEAVVVYFYSPRCPYCSVMTPLVEEESKKHDVRVYHFNVDQSPFVLDEYDLEGIPAIIYFERGKERDRLRGLVSNDIIDTFFEQVNK